MVDRLATRRVEPLTEEQEEAYWEKQRLSLLSWGRNLILLMMVITVVWGPADFLFYANEPALLRAALTLRLTACSVGLCAWLALGHVSFARRHPSLVLTAGISGVALLSGYALGLFGGPATLWYNFMPYFVLAPVAFSYRLRTRVAVTALFVASMVGGYFGMHPEYLQDRRAGPTISFTIAVAFFSILSGVMADRLRRENFFLQLATERQASELRDLLIRVQELAATDSLTSLRNAREFHEQLAQQCALSLRTSATLSLIIIDIDHFKGFNDRFGHVVGDAVLAIAAKTIRRAIRASDAPFRVGGEEFAVICPLADASAAADVANRIRLALSEKPFTFEGGAETITASFGVAGFRPGESGRELYQRADQALYKAKQLGRNRVELETLEAARPLAAQV
jgi:diguanylate cyclase (GGDEF)-like protein